MNSSKLDSNLIVFYLIEEKEACSKALTEGVLLKQRQFSFAASR